MTLLVWILGAVVGAVAWAAFLRLPGQLARWLCAPYGKPGPFAMALSLLISVSFLTLAVVGIFLGLSKLIESGTSTQLLNIKEVRGVLFLSSLLGYVSIPAAIRIEQLFRRQRTK